MRTAQIGSERPICPENPGKLAETAPPPKRRSRATPKQLSLAPLPAECFVFFSRNVLIENPNGCSQRGSVQPFAASGRWETRPLQLLDRYVPLSAKVAARLEFY